MSTVLHRHPRFAELRDEFRAHPEWFTPWTGTLFRFHTVNFPTATGGSGLLARSAAVRRGVNVVIFRGVCPGDQLQVVDAAKLDKLGVKLKA